MPYFGAEPSSELANLDINGQKLILDANGNTSITADTDDQIDIEISGADDFQFTANTFTALSGSTIAIASGATIANSGTATGFGGSDPASADGDSLGTASAEWSDLYLADGGIIYFGNDQDVTLTHDPDDGLLLNKALAVGDGTSSLPTLTNVGDLGTGLYFPGAGSIIGVATGGTDRHRFDGDEVYLNDTSAAYLNAGLCINQGAEDNEIFELKSSDVAHGVTDEAETDTFFIARKAGATEGGVLMRSYTEGDSSFVINATSTNDLSGDTASSGGHIHFTCFKKSGTGLAGHVVGSNLFVVENNTATQLILKGNGTLHLTNTTLVALDEEDDAMLIRQLDLVGHKDKESNSAGVIETEWDNFIEKNDAKLKEIGVLSSENDFIVVQPWIKLANGAIWQQRAMFETMKQVAEEMLPGFSKKLNERLEAQSLPALPV